MTELHDCPMLVKTVEENLKKSNKLSDLIVQSPSLKFYNVCEAHEFQYIIVSLPGQAGGHGRLAR